MSFTKRDLVQQALIEIGITPRQFSLKPEDYLDAAFRADAMMGEFSAAGINFSYPINEDAEPDLDSETNIPQKYRAMCYLNLAIRCCGMFGKEAPRTLLQAAKSAYDNSLGAITKPVPSKIMAGAFMGAGNRVPYGNASEFKQSEADIPYTNEIGQELDFA